MKLSIKIIIIIKLIITIMSVTALGITTLSIIIYMLSIIYAECYSNVLLRVVMLSIVIICANTLNVVIPSAVAPFSSCNLAA